MKDEIKSLVPVWFQLPRSFYLRLFQIAEECGLSPVAVLKEGITLVRAKHRKKLQHPTVDGDQSKAAAVLARKQWKKVPPEERRERARALAEKRWGKKSSD